MEQYKSASVKIIFNIIEKGELNNIPEELATNWESIIVGIIPEICVLSFEEKKEITKNSLFSFCFFTASFEEVLQKFLFQKALVN